MAEKVGIVALAQTKYRESRPDVREAELVHEVVSQVLEQTGLSFADGEIDAAVTCSQDLWDGRGISDIPIGDVVGAHLRPEEKVEDDGILAVFYAFAQILSGHYDTVLVTAHCKESQTIGHIVENAAFDPIYLRLLGLDFLSAAALQAKRYMHKYGIRPEQCAKVVVKNHRNARNNPYAQSPLPGLTVEEVLNSTLLCDPIRLLDCKPVSDGACALILAREEKARRLTNKAVWIKGGASCYDAHYLGERDLADCDSLVQAAKRAYRMAGISNPLKELDLAEISEVYSYQELLWYEGLGFCARGEGGKLIDARMTEMDGQLPVNPSGGVLAGNPTMVTGMARLAEAALQLRGEGGARQIPGAKTALAHGTTGPCGQQHCVIILGND